MATFPSLINYEQSKVINRRFLCFYHSYDFPKKNLTQFVNQVTVKTYIKSQIVTVREINRPSLGFLDLTV